MTKLCPRGKAAAKRKFAVYPSAYANAYASKICAGKIKDPSGVRRKDFKGPKPAMKGGMMKYAKGDQVKVNKVATALRKASKLHASQAKTLSTVKAKEGSYIGSYIKSEIDGKKISNKSYEKYYKGMI
jgi:hypothetical protein|tara:strand:- start:75 stop:458 length:384 start_codon:yes stop_codon:yes gene_type:complete